MEAFWKDDFAPLQAANKAVLRALRADEEAPDADLYRRILSTSITTVASSSSSSPALSQPETSNKGAHLYFSSDNYIGNDSNASSSSHAGASSNGMTNGRGSSSTTPAGRGPLMPAASAFSQTPASHEATATRMPRSVPVLRMKHKQSLPLMSELKSQVQTTRQCSLMGFFAPVQMAWMTVDERLYLFPAASPQQAVAAASGGSSGSATFTCFTNSRKQPIQAVALVRPKPGVFKSIVPWCIVVTTPEEVLLLALMVQQEDGCLRLVETAFSMSSDSLKFNAVTGTESGRIFLGANDGSLHEMVYEDLAAKQQAKHSAAVSFAQEQLDQFYNGDKNLPSVLYPSSQAESSSGTISQVLTMGKRTLQVISGFDNDHHYGDSRHYGAGDEGSRKCRKLNRTSQASNSSVNASDWMPDFVHQATRFVLGKPAATAGGQIVQLVMDEERQCLYSLTQKGWIAAFDVSRKDAAPLACIANMPPLVRLYLETVQRGQHVPPRSDIRFPGGAAAASAGVGGMDGARDILKQTDNTARRQNTSGNRGTPHALLTPVQLHVIPRSESSRLTLMAVTAGGLRLYLSSLPTQTLNTLDAGASSTSMYSSRYGSVSSTSNPWGPSNRLTLCHIRAPPPVAAMPSTISTGGSMGSTSRRNEFNYGNSSSTTSSAAINTIESGMKPQVSRLNQPQRIDASFYEAGHWVAALEDQANNKGNDLILSAAPDALARIALEPDDSSSSSSSSSSSINNSNRRAVTRMTAPGGLAETLSLPMSSAYGSSDSNAATMHPAASASNTTTPVLSGGLLWEITAMDDYGNEDSATCQRRQQVLALTLNSQTPSDADLEVGLPPAFYPPSKIRTQQGPGGQALGGSNGSSGGGNVSMATTLTVPRSSTWQMFFNALTARPINHGLSLRQGEAEPFAEEDYRISTRTGVKGFSLTAAETMRQRSSSVVGVSPATAASKARKAVAKSARLRPSLLRPPVVPLNPFATHHLVSTKRQIVALNVQGLHYFEFNTVLSSLADALIAADNPKDDATVSSFFTGYGYKEGCSMCLALAIGAGPAGGDAVYNQQMRRAARDAALARAFVPKLVQQDYQNSSGTPTIGSDGTTDPFIPSGFTFCPSALSEGLTMLFSRLARPVWNKPYVVVTEGRDIKLAWSGGTKAAPAKVEILFEEDTLEEIRGPLRSLLKLAKEAFSPAVRAVPGTTMQSQGDMFMDIDMAPGQSQYLTQALQHLSHRRAGNGVGANAALVLTARDAEEIARLVEERNIHSLYRLMSRAVQFLNLVSLLRTAEKMVELPKVDWGLLHGLTISQLVQNPEGQDRLEALLNSLVVSPAAGGPNAARSAQADQLAAQLAEQCYLYFPPASRFAYEGLRLANAALSAPPMERHRLENEATANLCKAARHWYSPPLITGRVIRSNGKESYEQIALRAMQYESPLATATDALVKLGNVGGAVEICLTTAANFKPGSMAAREGVQIQGAFAWEYDLYHKQREAVGSGNDSTSSGYGTNVTPQDAIDTCHALIFYYLSSLLLSNKNLAWRMLSACAAAPDTSFLADLFSYMLERDETDTLLQLESPHLDAWLSKRNDANLLCSYYTIHNRHVDSARVMSDWACSTILKLSVTDRIFGLSKALSSYQEAQRDRNLHSQGISKADLDAKVNEVRNKLEVARLQSRAIDAIRSNHDLEMRLDAESREKLHFTLVSVTELYNEYAAKLSLYDVCLALFHACRQDNDKEIRALWKNYLSEDIVPCATRSRQLYEFLQDFVQDVDLGNGIKLLSETSTEPSEYQLFESGSWILRLQGKVVSLGKELYGTGADYTFPVAYLLSLLESLRQSNPAVFPSTAWSLTTLVDAGVPYLVVLSVFESFSQQDGRVFVGGGDDQTAAVKLTAPVELLGYWLENSRSSFREAGDQVNTAQAELSRAMVTGEVMKTIDSLKSKLEITNVPSCAYLRERLATIEQALQSSY